MRDNKQWIQGYFLTGETSENLVLHVENFVFHLIHFFLILEKKKRHWFKVELFILFFFIQQRPETWLIPWKLGAKVTTPSVFNVWSHSGI